MRIVLPGLAAIPMALFALAWTGWRENDARLAEIASQIAGQSVEVRCERPWEDLVDVSSNAGSVKFHADGSPSERADLDRGTCSTLEEFAESDKSALGCLVVGSPCGEEVWKASSALHVLAHESFHLAGIQDEATADCYAFQRVELAAVELGATPREGSGLAELALYTRAKTAPPEYRSDQCGPGGRLDLDPDRPAWP